MIALRLKVGSDHFIVHTKTVTVGFKNSKHAKCTCERADDLLAILRREDATTIEFASDSFNVHAPAWCIKDAWEES